MFNKKGVDAVVAIVLIIMITIAAVAIVWAFIIPLVKDSLKESTSEKVSLSIETVGGYTTWDEIRHIARVQVKRGNDNLNLTGIDFNFIKGGNSVERNRPDVPQPNQAQVYEFNLEDLNGRPEKVLVAPVTTGGVGAVVSESNILQNYSGDSASTVLSSPRICTSFTYTEWSVCNATGSQNRTINNSLPVGCTGGTSEALVQSCTYFHSLTVSGATDNLVQDIENSYVIVDEVTWGWLYNDRLNYSGEKKWGPFPDSNSVVYHQTTKWNYIVWGVEIYTNSLANYLPPLTGWIDVNNDQPYALNITFYPGPAAPLTSDFNGNYIYDSSQSKWLKGTTHSIYKEGTLWIMTDGNINYTAVDYGLITLPTSFNYSINGVFVCNATVSY